MSEYAGRLLFAVRGDDRLSDGHRNHRLSGIEHDAAVGAGAESFSEIQVVVGFDDFVRDCFDAVIVGIDEGVFLIDDVDQFIQADI